MIATMAHHAPRSPSPQRQGMPRSTLSLLILVACVSPSDAFTAVPLKFAFHVQSRPTQVHSYHRSYSFPATALADDENLLPEDTPSIEALPGVEDISSIETLPGGEDSSEFLDMPPPPPLPENLTPPTDPVTSIDDLIDMPLPAEIPSAVESPWNVDVDSIGKSLDIPSPAIELPSLSGFAQGATDAISGSVESIVVSERYWSTIKQSLLIIGVGQVAAAALIATVWNYISSNLPELKKTLVNIYAQKDDEGNEIYPRTKEGFEFPDLAKLAACIAIDVIGTSNELIPWNGEIIDVIWAPIAAIAVRKLFWDSNVVFMFELAEELLPFTDFIPLASICWVVETMFSSSDAAKLLGVGDYRYRRPLKRPVEMSDFDIYADEMYFESTKSSKKKESTSVGEKR